VLLHPAVRLRRVYATAVAVWPQHSHLLPETFQPLNLQSSHLEQYNWKSKFFQNETLPTNHPHQMTTVVVIMWMELTDGRKIP